MANTHALRRTSPKGQDFVGTCTKCGRRGLTFADLNEECENIRGTTQSEDVIEAVTGKPPKGE